jgi:ribosome biogenesis GTPase
LCGENRQVIQDLRARRVEQEKDRSQYLVGQITAAFGRHYEVKTQEGGTYSCVMRGKKKGVACGDRVEILPTTTNQAVIETVLPRTSLFYRSDAFREKLIAANVTQLVFVVAGEPSFSLELLDRCLIAAESQGIKPLILLNKIDLIEQTRVATKRLAFYRDLGYPVFEISAKTTAQSIILQLHGQTSLLAGQSGMGKSTLLNALIPQAHQSTAEISEALDSGRHVTTHARLFRLNANSYIIDSPGFQEFGLQQLDEQTLVWGFIEFRPLLGQCRFRNCRHISEPACALLEATQAGIINERRMACYQKLIRSINKPYAAVK